LQAAVRLIGSEEFTATVGDACGYCAFHRICPAQEAGGSVVPRSEGEFSQRAVPPTAEAP
jgi:hypothetical protein